MPTKSGMTTVRDLPFNEWGAYYDTKKDMICNCQYGSRTWHHEDRHRQQVNSKFWKGYFVFDMCCYFGASLQILGLYYKELIFLTVGAGFLSIYMMMIFLLEIDAEIYSLIKWFKNEEIKR